MNIVLIVVDTLRYDCVQAYSGKRVKTPNMDRLSKRAWNFHRTFVNSFPTIPHRTDVITGKYGNPFNPWQPLNPEYHTFPEALAGEGYCTQLIHDTPHLVNGQHGFDFPFHAWTPVRGAEVDRSWIKDHCEFPAHWKRLECFDNHELSDADILAKSNCLQNYIWTNGRLEKDEDWNAARLFSTASQFLEDNANRENFFLWVDSFDPHEPWDAPPEYVSTYDADDNPDGNIDPRSFLTRSVDDLSERACEHITACYNAKTAFMDAWLGHFLDTMEKTGLDKNTAIIFTADHGTNLGDSRARKFGKGGGGGPLINEAHVPLMIATPEGDAGDSHMVVQPQDVYNTVLSMADVPLNRGVDSYDVLSPVRNNSDAPRKFGLTGQTVRFHNAGPEDIALSAYTKDRYLYMTPDPQHCEVYDYENGSSHQTDDAARNEFRTEIMEELERRGLPRPLRKRVEEHGHYPLSEPLGWIQYFQKRYKGT